MLIIHHLGISQSERIVWLCEELEIPYELRLYERDPVTRLAPAVYKALHPMGSAPVITDGDLVLGESGAVIEYIIARHGQNRLAVPPSAPNFPDYLFWFHFANASYMATEATSLFASMLGAAPDHAVMLIIKDRRDRALGLMESRLSAVPYFAGDEFTAADIFMVFGLTTIRLFAPQDLSGFPSIRSYLKRIGARPAYQRAMAKGDPGMPLLLE